MASARAVLRSWIGELASNPGYKLASVVVAVLAWWHVQGQQLVQDHVRATLAWNLPQGLMSTEPLPQSALVTVTGTRSAVRLAQRAGESGGVQVAADVADLGVGEHTVEFAAMEVHGLPPSVATLGFAPATLRVNFDELSMRKVKVRPVLVGDPAPGYVVAPPVMVDPAVVEIRGPHTSVADLVEVATKPIDVSGLTGQIDAPVDLELPWGVMVASGSQVRARVEVEPKVDRQVLASVPVMVFGLTDWVPVPSTAEVTLEGPASALTALDRRHVAVFAYLPDNATQASYKPEFGPKEGLRLEVATYNEYVRAVAVKPSVIEVRKR